VIREHPLGLGMGVDDANLAQWIGPRDSMVVTTFVQFGIIGATRSRTIPRRNRSYWRVDVRASSKCSPITRVTTASATLRLPSIMNPLMPTVILFR